MSLRILTVGPEVSGTSTVAGQVALLLHKLAGRKGKPLAICTAAALVYRTMPVQVKAARSAREFLEALQAASGTVIGDQFSDLYSDMLVGSYVDASRKARAEAGLPDHWGALAPNDFRLIRNRFDGLSRTARDLDCDLIEVYRLGPGEDGEMRVRGASGTGRGASLILLLDGGLGRHYRRIRVFSDASLKATKESRELPAITSPKDLKKLADLLSNLLTPSLQALLEVREEAKLWASVPELDYWPEVSEAVQRAEAELIVAEIKALCEINEISGIARTRLLYQHFKVGDIETLFSVPILTLRANRERFALAASQWAERERQAEAIRTEVRQLLAMHRLSGTSQDAQEGRARRLREAFQTDLEGLDRLGLEALKEGMVLFLAGLPQGAS